MEFKHREYAKVNGSPRARVAGERDPLAMPKITDDTVNEVSNLARSFSSMSCGKKKARKRAAQNAEWFSNWQVRSTYLDVSTRSEYQNMPNPPQEEEELEDLTWDGDVNGSINKSDLADYVSANVEKQANRRKYHQKMRAKRNARARDLKLRCLKSKGAVRKTKTYAMRTLTDHDAESLISSSESAAYTWTTIKAACEEHISDPAVRKKMIAVLLCLMTCLSATSSLNVILAITSLINSEFSGEGGLYDYLWGLVMQLNDTYEQVPSISVFSSDDDDEDSMSEGLISASAVVPEGKIIDTIQAVRHNWNLFKSGPMFDKFHNFVSAITCFGVLNPREYDVSIHNVKLFAMNTKDRAMDANTAVDAIVDMVTYLSESGIYSFAQKSIKPFFFDDKLAMDMDDEYLTLCKMTEDIVAGNLQRKHGITESDLEDRIDKLLTKMQRAHVTSKGPIRAILLKRLETVGSWHERVVEARIASGTRKAPFHPVILGDSNIGKTTLTQLFGREVGVRQGFHSASEYQTIIQGNAKFWETTRSKHRFYIIEDFANTKPQFAQEDEGMKHINICANVDFRAPRAEADQKNRVIVDPDLVVTNTNNETMGSEVSVCAYSRYRRGHIYVRCTVKEKYARYVGGVRQNEIDNDKIVELFGRLDENGDPVYDENGTQVLDLEVLPDMWDVTIQKPYMAKVTPVQESTQNRKRKHIKKKAVQDSTVQWQTVKFMKDGQLVLAEDISILDALDCTCEFASRHFSTQNAMLELQKKQDEKFVKCECCGKSVAYCNARKSKEEENAQFEEYEKQRVAIRQMQREKKLAKQRQSEQESKPSDPLEKDENGKPIAEGLISASLTSYLPFNWRVGIRMARDNWNYRKLKGVDGLVKRATDFAWNFIPFVEKRVQTVEQMVATYTTKQLVQTYAWMTEISMFDISFWIPDFCLNHPLVAWYTESAYASREKWHRERIMKWFIKLPILAWMTVSMAIGWFSNTFIASTVFNGWLCTLFYFSTMERVKREVTDAMVAEIAQREKALGPVAKAWKEKYGKYLFYGLGILAAILIVLRILKSLSFTNLTSASLLAPVTRKELEERDSLPNEWATTISDQWLRNNVTKDQIVGVAKKNTFEVKLYGDQSISTMRGLVLHNGLIAIPTHAFVEAGNVSTLEIRRNKWYVKVPVDEGNVYFDDCDIAYVYSGKIRGSNLLKHLRKTNTSTNKYGFSHATGVATLLRMDGTWTEEEQPMRWLDHVNPNKGRYPGWVYKMSAPFQIGNCGSPTLIRDGNSWHVGGIYLAGKEGIGSSGSISEAHVLRAVEKFKNFPDIADCGLISASMIGKTDAVKLGTEIGDSSPLKWHEADHHYTHLGSTGNDSKFYSSVKPSLIAETVERVTGVKNNYGPPSTKPWWKPWHLDLDKRSNQPIGFSISEFQGAADEYLEDLKKGYEKVPKEVKDELLKRPLTKKEILFGIPGHKFIDRMNFSSSLGFPYAGAKKKYCILDENDEIVDFKSWIWDEVEKVEASLARGERANQPFKASLKDEITKQYNEDGTPNEKVRVFTCAPITLQILIRKYFLPVAAFMSRFPLLSEQAVGINASGPDFHELVQHMCMNDVLGHIAGDFSKFDIGMNCDSINSAFFVMIKFARDVMGYSERACYIMQMLANEVSNPLVDYKGELIMMNGSHPSGQNMTVYINGIVNSIYYRVVFNRLKKEFKRPNLRFKDYCNLIVYGDDSWLTRKKEALFMTFNNVAKEFQKVGIRYTPADKSASAPDTVPLKEVDFLKRKAIYNQPLKMYMGALDKNSIMKSLFCNAGDGLPADVAAGVNLDGSIREMFNHGKTAYEEWRKTCSTIAKAHNIEHWVNNLYTDYDSYLKNYIERYNIKS